ncbi:transposase [Acetobacterium sp.]|uniref:transposase n=1 Tax=Acetobacterium sp. TaxID=1872094 RepID=UPI002F414827
MSQYTDEFKKQIVNLYNNEKAPSEIIEEYKIARSTLHKWVKDYNGIQSFKTRDNRSTEEIELLSLKKELNQLRMENDILKQAALIMGRR